MPKLLTHCYWIVLIHSFIIISVIKASEKDVANGTWRLRSACSQIFPAFNVDNPPINPPSRYLAAIIAEYRSSNKPKNPNMLKNIAYIDHAAHNSSTPPTIFTIQDYLRLILAPISPPSILEDYLYNGYTISPEAHAENIAYMQNLLTQCAPLIEAASKTHAPVSTIPRLEFVATECGSFDLIEPESDTPDREKKLFFQREKQYLHWFNTYQQH